MSTSLEVLHRNGQTTYRPPCSENSAPNTTLLKYKHDAAKLKAHARWVLAIDAGGAVLSLTNNNPYVANVIAVLGPAVIHGHVLSETVLLEVGVSRGRPYTLAESKNGGAVRYVTKRRKAGDLSLEQFARLWPTIISLMEECIVAARARWKVKDAWTTVTPAGVKDFEKGIYFTIALSDALLHEVFLLHDVSGRHYLTRNARFIEHFLHRYKYVYYPARQLKTFAGAQKVVDLWRNMAGSSRWSPRYARRVLRTLSSKKRALFEHIADVFKLNLGEYEEDRILHAQARGFRLPNYLRVRFDGAGKAHGKGCSIFEVFFSKEHREEYQI